jgi:hypothetical protein
MSSRSIKTITDFSDVTVIEHDVLETSIAGPQDPKYIINVSDPMVAKYSFDGLNVAENEHNPGTYDATLTGTSRTAGIASNDFTLFQHNSNGVDASTYDRAIVTTSTLVADFSNDRMNFDGNGGYRISGLNDLATIKFTVEATIYLASINTGSSQLLFDHHDGAAQGFYVQVDDITGELTIAGHAPTWDAYATGAFVQAGIEFHFAVVHTIDDLQLFVDGVMVSSNAINMVNGATTIVVGEHNAGTQKTSTGSYFKNVRVSNGAIYSPVGFEPPTTPFDIYESQYGLARSFNGSSDYIDIQGAPELNFRYDATFAVWCKTTQANRWVLACSDQSAGNNVNGFWWIEGNTSGNQVKFHQYPLGAWSITSTTAINDGNWHHVAVTKSSELGIIALYIDGVFEGSNVGAVPTTDNSGMTLGYWSLAGMFRWAGSMDDIRFFNKALSVEEIQSLFKPGAKVVLEETPSVVSYEMDAILENVIAEPLAYFPLDIIDGTPSYILESISQTQILSGANFPSSTTNLSGDADTALAFNGVDNIVLIDPNPMNVLGSSDWAISVWVYFNNLNAGRYTIFGHVSGTGGSWGDLGIVLTRNDNAWLAQASNNGGSGSTINTGTALANQWMHLIYMNDAGTKKLYENGVLIGTEATTTSVPNQPTWSARLGEGYTAGTYFDGRMDDLIIYSHSLSPEEIGNLYNGGNLNGVASKEGIFVKDSIANTDGVVVGDVISLQARTNYNGSSYYNDPSFTPGNGFNFDNDFTVAMQIRRTGTGTIKSIFELVSGSTFGLILNSDQLNLWYTGSSFISGVTLVQDQWYSVVATHLANDTLELFIDGVSMGTVTGSSGITGTSLSAYIGASSTGGRIYEGDLRYIQLFSGMNTPEAWNPLLLDYGMIGSNIVVNYPNGSPE